MLFLTCDNASPLSVEGNIDTGIFLRITQASYPGRCIMEPRESIKQLMLDHLSVLQQNSKKHSADEQRAVDLSTTGGRSSMNSSTFKRCNKQSMINCLIIAAE